MPRDFSMENVSGMLDGLKSRLGFNRDEGRYSDDRYDDERYAPGEYDDYGDFEEYGDYGEYNDYDDRNNQAGGYRPASTSSSRSRFGRADSSPNLVSFDDVKANTSVPSRLQRDSLPPRGGNFAATSNVGGHTVIDTTVPAPASPAYKAAIRDGSMRSEGLNTLFEPTTGSAAASGATYDPYEAYSSSTPSKYTQSRALTVVKPTVYGDVERVARAVKSGDIVVLVMRNTPDELSKRILDFSFGVASALDANVECPGDKVFAIARGNALTEDEKRRLRAQSVL